MGQHTYLKRQSSADRQTADTPVSVRSQYPNSALNALYGGGGIHLLRPFSHP